MRKIPGSSSIKCYGVKQTLNGTDHWPMTKRILWIFVVAAVSSACAANREVGPTNPTPKAGPSSQILVKTESLSPEIGIDEYTVITSIPDTDLANAVAVMEVKKLYPLAMRKKDRALFERILSRDFTFRGTKDFFNRGDYIENRTQGAVTDWSVKYENIVLQFVGDICILTYRNVVGGQDKNGSYTERMTWSDVYVRENDQWKIRTVHLIDYKEENF